MKIPAVLIMLLAVVIAVVPFFTNCQSEGKTLTLANGRTVPMKCLWTAMTEIAVGLPLLAVGGMLALSRRKETRRMLGIMGVLLGAFTVLLPTTLIGVCAMPDALCNMVLRPSMIFAGNLIMLISLGTLVYSERMAEAVA